MDDKSEPFVCLFCGVTLPEPTEPTDYDRSYRCGSCRALYGFEDETDAFEFYRDAADELGIPDGEPLARIRQLETNNRLFDVLKASADAEESEGEKIYVFFARLKQT